MYHPYFRGKLNELITVRETAPLLAARKFIPIIEPVKEALSGLKRTLEAVVEAEGRAVVVVNPFHGDQAWRASIRLACDRPGSDRNGLSHAPHRIECCLGAAERRVHVLV